MNYIVFFASTLGALTAVAGLAMGSYSVAETVLLLSCFALAFWCLFEGEK